MTETWKDIPGYEGQYQVSDLGQVRRLPRTVRFVSKTGTESWHKAQGKACALNVSREGYALVHFQVDRVRASPTVHELVLRAFVGPRPTGLDINHINGIKTDNRLSNLEYVSRTENHKHAVRMGLNKQAVPVVSSTGAAFPSISEAERALGLPRSTLYCVIDTGKVRAGQTWSRA